MNRLVRAGIATAVAAELVGTIPHVHESPRYITTQQIQELEYPTLPTGIELDEQNTVTVQEPKIQISFTDTNGRSLGEWSRGPHGTGVIVQDGEEIITAAHVLNDPQVSCPPINLFYSHNLDPTNWSGKVINHTKVTDSSASVSDTDSYNHNLDAGVVQLKGFDDPEPSLHVPVQAAKIALGSELFVVTARYATDKEIVVPGIVISTGLRKLTLLTLADADHSTRSGDSGAGTVTSNNQFIGENIGGDADNGGISPEKLRDEFGAILPTNAKRLHFATSVIQLLEASDMATMTSSNNVCTPLAQIPKIQQRLLPGQDPTTAPLTTGY